jgi:2-amino-4-hydroxy-6-hydroxymethyldihydropteridine diphosphokinase|tara:strand:+ start:896 stop:1411 length:516 start_codon:yes stop_codon:yes gene_type:complete
VKKQDILENQVKFSYLALGSNLGDKLQNLEKAKFELEKHKIKIIKSSSNFLSISWPDSTKPKFVNLVLKIKTNLSAVKLLKVCNFIEQKLGRVRSKKNDPRLCDIDIIDYKHKIVKNNNLILPHPRMTKRNFVLLPLFEIDKSWIHPKSKTNIVNLINSLPIKDLRSIKQI